MNFLVALLSLVTSITPSRTWYPPAEPLLVAVKTEGDARLVLMTFEGKELAPKGSADVSGEKTVNLKDLWPESATAGTYVLLVVPKGKPVAQFEGTPQVIEVRAERKRGGDPEVTKILPLEYVVMTTAQGPMTMMFYYDVAPITVESFLNLCRTGYYDKLTFHRIVPKFVIQGGDPKGDGTGGPGYTVPAEFNDRPHHEGVLSMARTADPNSGGSQFFVCLDYNQTQHLDHQYTAFGRVVSGMDAVKKIAATPADAESGRPQTPQVIQHAEVKPVMAAENPYAEFFHMKEGAGAGK